jgi:predicted metal-binding protein
MKKASASPDLERFVERACELGALEAKLIDASSIVTAAWVRLKCQFGCGGYGGSHCCPPNTPTPLETQAVIDCYNRAILIHRTKLGSTTKIVIELEREIFLSGFYKAFGFGAGPCSLCRECHPDACMHPEKARPSMEACGIDVYATARNSGYTIDVVKDHSCSQNYYGLILVD